MCGTTLRFSAKLGAACAFITKKNELKKAISCLYIPVK